MRQKTRIWLGFFLVTIFAKNSYCSLWDAGDALIVEVDDDLNSNEDEATTFGPTTDREGACLTSGGLSGECIKSRDCFPYLYLGGTDGLEYEKIYGLRELVQNTTESCDQGDSTTISSLDPVKPGDELVCCITLSRSIGRQIPKWPIQQGPIQQPESKAAAAGSPAKKPACGVTKYVLVDKVVGGREAYMGEFPWIVALVNDKGQFCGGTLIDSKTVITAAHCVNSLRSAPLLKKVILLIGDHNLYTISEVQHETRRVKRLVFHKKFNDRVLQYDIAMLHLDKPVTFTEKIKPVCLHPGFPAYDSGQTNAVVSGWGKIYHQGPQSQNLMTARIRIWTNAECSAKYRGTNSPAISETMSCAGTPAPMRDSCQGDSGGPLTVNNNGREYLAGIVSWGLNCGQYPGVYTRVDKYLQWIEKHRSK